MQLSVSFRFGVLASFVAIALLPVIATAQTPAECNFGRTLDVGVDGEDVRCLQEFLNARGVTIASEGPGSPGNETTRYGSLTEAAVLRWQQAQNIAGANGVFGPQSQAAYLLDRVNALESQMAAVAPVTTVAPTPQVAGAATSANDEAALVAQFLKALTAIEAGDDEVEYRILNDQTYDNHLRALNKAKRSFFAAATAYFSGSVSQVPALLTTVLDNAGVAADDTSESSSKSSTKTTSSKTTNSTSGADESEAWDAVDGTWDKYDDVKSVVSDAEDDGVDTDEAYSLLKKASKTLQAAEDAIDDENYDGAIALADEAAGILNDAKKAAK